MEEVIIEKNVEFVSNSLTFKSLYNSGVYCLTFPNGKKYIGRSIDFKNRFKSYKNVNCKFQTRLLRAINKYGWDNVRIEILLYAEDEENLNNAEKYFIKFYNSIEDGYNLLTGGHHGTPCEETRKRMSEAQIGRKHSEKTKQKMSRSSSARSEEISLHNKELWIKNKEKYSLAHQGIKHNYKDGRVSSKYIGIGFNKKSELWRATITYKSIEIHIGYFKNEIDAALAYNQKAIELHGDKAKLNIIQEE